MRGKQLNTFGHLLTFKHFARLLPSKKDVRDASGDDLAQGLIADKLSICASITARVGSIADNERGGSVCSSLKLVKVC